MALQETEAAMRGCSLIPSPSPEGGRELFPSPYGRGVGVREQGLRTHPSLMEHTQ